MNVQTEIAADPISQLEAALATALPMLEGAKKNAANPHFKSKYADLGAVIEAVRPIADHGIWFRQVLHESAEGVTVETLYTGHGTTISAGTLFMPADKRNAQGYGSALTYARRYALQTAFGLSTEDDDGNAASAKQEAKPAAKPPAHSALKTQLRAFVHEMEGCGDSDELSAFLNSKESQALIGEVETKLPEWWLGGDEMPPEFVPLKTRIENKEYELAQQIADLARA